MDIEKKIEQTLNNAINEAILKQLVGYSSPLNDLIINVINNNRSELQAKLDIALTTAIDSNEFKQNMKNAFTYKLAKVLIDKTKGAIEKAANDHWSNPTMRAKMIIAIENIIKENEQDQTTTST